MSWFKSIATASVLAVAATAANAVTVDLTGISGVWQNAVTAGDPVTSSAGGSIISWGPERNDLDLESSYEFNAASTPQNNVSSPFSLGEFVHNNWTISTANVLQSVDLAVNIQGNVDGQAFNLNPVFSFTHFETINAANPCAAGGSNPCPDLVTLVNSQDLSQSLTLADGSLITLTILGFDTGSGPLSTFLTEESNSNSANLIGSFDVRPGATIPLPAAGWLLIGGLGVLGAVKRRSKKA